MSYLTALSLPLLHYFDIWDTWLLHLHPLQAPLVLPKAAFVPIEPWQWVYGVLYSILWIVVLLHFDRRVFDRFIIAREGATDIDPDRRHTRPWPDRRQKRAGDSMLRWLVAMPISLALLTRHPGVQLRATNGA